MQNRSVSVGYRTVHCTTATLHWKCAHDGRNGHARVTLAKQPHHQVERAREDKWVKHVWIEVVKGTVAYSEGDAISHQ